MECGPLFGNVALVVVGPESVLPLAALVDGGFVLEHPGFEDGLIQESSHSQNTTVLQVFHSSVFFITFLSSS